MREQLLGKRAEILRQWLEAAVRLYSAPHARFLLADADPFRNPAGHTLRGTLEALFDWLAGGGPPAPCRPLLETLIRLRAVLDVPPSQSLAFLLQLGDILRQQLGSAGGLEPALDAMVLTAFDIYVESREKLYQIRAGEAKRRLYLLERLHPEFVPASPDAPPPARGDTP